MLDTFSTKKALSLTQRKQSQFRIWGIKSYPEKTDSIQDMDTPQNVSDVRRFLGMVNQLGKFVPHLAEKKQTIQGSSKHEE